MKLVMFDTNIFNHVLDQNIDLSPFVGKLEVLVTHVQRDELNATKNDSRRMELKRIFVDLTNRSVPTESAVRGVSKWGDAKWTRPNSICSRMKTRLDLLNNGKRNNIQDALIAETAIINHLVLVSDDEDLRQTTSEFSGHSMSLNELIAELRPRAS